MDESRTTLVIPTVGRPSLRVLLEALAAGTTPVEAPVVVVDDRPGGRGDGELLDELADVGLEDLTVLRSGGRGPAAARNLGWRHARTPWVSFLDDDVVTDRDWYERLLRDLDGVGPGIAGSQGRVRVPQPTHRRPTDWERGTAGLASARWITADMSYRRRALAAVGGFDERFPRAFREDADLGLRITRDQGLITEGRRWITHPVRPADDWASLKQQRGNADDFLMRGLHGRDWRQRAGAPPGRRPRHVAVAGSALVAATAAATRRRRLAGAAALAWAAGTAELAWARIAPGPRDPAELRRMLLTSVAIPWAATWHSARGAWQHRRVEPWQGLPELVLFDRDGTLVHDVPYNGDPAKVSPVARAAESLERLRRAGVLVGVVSNQSGIGTGRLTTEQVESVNARVSELLGPFEVWRYCPHAPDDPCACRKPAPGMVKDCCEELDVLPARTVVVGDVGSDVEAATAAGAHAILVPTPSTRVEEVSSATTATSSVAPTLAAAVEQILAARW
jgi:HAD superfamily hydrolase (TIGR01662 family)